MPVRTLWGVGPATADHLRRAGITHRRRDRAGRGVRAGAAARQGARRRRCTRWPPVVDNRPVVADRDVKSISVEDTFDGDLTDRARVRYEIDRLAERCVQRLRGAGPLGPHGRRQGPAVRLLHAHPLRDAARPHRRPRRGPGDRPPAARGRRHDRRRAAAGCRRGRAGRLHPGGPVRTGAGGAGRPAATAPPELPSTPPPAPEPGRHWLPGLDVAHEEYGAGWVQGSGVGRVTVRFEVPSDTLPGRVPHLSGGRPGARPQRAPAAGRADRVTGGRGRSLPARELPEVRRTASAPHRTSARPSRSGGRAAVPARATGGGPPRSPARP